MKSLKPVYFASALLAVVLSATVAAVAVEVSPDEAGKPAEASAMTEGEVKKVNKDAAKLTIKHGPLSNLDMPAMTMVFRVQDPAMLDQLKEGDQIRFIADKIGGQYTVTQIEKR